MTKALIVVDVQNDFCEGGSLAVNGGSAVAAGIAEFLNEHRSAYDFVVATQDWHRDPGGHFSDDPDYNDSWPAHCRAGTEGAFLHPALDDTAFDEVFRKGLTEAAYSGFQGTSDDIGEPLTVWLRARRVDEVDVVGIAYGHCVKATAIDAAKEGFDTVVLKEFTASVNPDNDRADTADLLDANVTVLA